MPTTSEIASFKSKLGEVQGMLYKINSTYFGFKRPPIPSLQRESCEEIASHPCTHEISVHIKTKTESRIPDKYVGTSPDRDKDEDIWPGKATEDKVHLPNVNRISWITNPEHHHRTGNFGKIQKYLREHDCDERRKLLFEKDSLCESRVIPPNNGTTIRTYHATRSEKLNAALISEEIPNAQIMNIQQETNIGSGVTNNEHSSETKIQNDYHVPNLLNPPPPHGTRKHQERNHESSAHFSSVDISPLTVYSEPRQCTRPHDYPSSGFATKSSELAKREYIVRVDSNMRNLQKQWLAKKMKQNINSDTEPYRKYPHKPTEESTPYKLSSVESVDWSNKIIVVTSMTRAINGLTRHIDTHSVGRRQLPSRSLAMNSVHSNISRDRGLHDRLKLRRSSSLVRQRTVIQGSAHVSTV